MKKEGYKGKFKADHILKFRIPNGIVMVLEGKIHKDKTYITIQTQYGEKIINNRDIVELKPIVS